MFLAAIGLISSVVVGQDNFPDPPRDQWARDAVAQLGADGFSVDEFRGPVGPSRKQMAAAFYKLELSILKTRSRVDRLSLKLSLDTPNSDAAWSDLYQARWFLNPRIAKDLDFLVRADQEFAPELKAMGVPGGLGTRAAKEYAEVLRGLRFPEVGSALKQFSDVPKDTWAARFVLEMRSAGLLRGYPDGTFKG